MKPNKYTLVLEFQKGTQHKGVSLTPLTNQVGDKERTDIGQLLFGDNILTLKKEKVTTVFLRNYFKKESRYIFIPIGKPLELVITLSYLKEWSANYSQTVKSGPLSVSVIMQMKSNFHF